MQEIGNGKRVPTAYVTINFYKCEGLFLSTEMQWLRVEEEEVFIGEEEHVAMDTIYKYGYTEPRTFFFYTNCHGYRWFELDNARDIFLELHKAKEQQLSAVRDSIRNNTK